MPVSTAAVGKEFPATTYAVGREKIREYAHAVGETNPLHLDVDAARAAGHRDLVAPPMFVVVYTARMVHGGQEFCWGPLVIAGDEITTRVSVKSIEQREGMGFYVFESISTNEAGAEVCVGTWTNVVRGV
jgi:acyl dehydratase